MLTILPGVTSASSALQAERIRMEVIAHNVANVNTTRDSHGKPYQRQVVVFENELVRAMEGPSGVGLQKVQVARIQPDVRPPRLVFNPDHPDANPQTGMLAMPNINIHEEMADLIAASRSFEANLAVVKNARHMAMQTLSIGKR